MMRFAGRDTELATIMARWQRVADHDAPVAQVVLIRAERGIGKTRLALEVQRAIRSSMQDDDGYWPDVSARQAGGAAGGMDVNADPRACRFDRPIPFMWWGVRAADPGADNALAGNALSTYEPWLAPQLVALAVRARVLRTGKAIFDVWRDVAMGELASWTGYDTVMSIGEGLFRTVSIVRGTAQSRGAAAAQDAMHKRQTDRVEDILDELDSIFNPRALSFARTPGVIFIDDAQFMTRDPGLAAFTEVLLRRAVAQSWPVLILVTHWRRELDLDLAREDPSFARILDAARHGDGAFLDASNLLDLDLQPLADLSEVLVDALPGLLPAQARALLDHAGGNPRHLEQIIAFLHENEDFFEDFDTSGPLTEDGLAAALEETHDLFKVVLRRLRDAPLEVQEAICIASLQGVRFVSGVVDDVMTAHLGKPPGGALAAAADPYSMVRPEAAGQIATFAERLFHQVAERRRRSLKALADDAALHSALKAALAGRLDDPAFDATADIQTRALTYGLAAQVFAADDADRPARLAALARLALLEDARNAYHAAAAAARDFASAFTSENAPSDPAAQRAVNAIATILREDGAADAVVGMLKALSAIQTEHWSNDPGTEALHARFWTLATLGDALLDLARLDEAAERFDTALALVRGGVAVDGTAFDVSLLVTALERVGWAQQARGDFNAARAAYAETVALARDRIDTLRGKTAEASGSDLNSALRDLGTALEKLGHIEDERADHLAATAAHVEAHDIARVLANGTDEPQPLGDLSVSYKRMGDIRRDRGDAEAAMAHYLQSLELARRVLALRPSPGSRHLVMAALTSIAGSATKAGDFAAAEAAYAEALDLARDLHAQLKSPQSLDDLGHIWRFLGRTRLFRDDPVAAADAFGAALDCQRRRHVRLNTAESMSGLAEALADLAHADAARDDPEAAVVGFDEAIILHRKALDRARPVEMRLSFVQCLIWYGDLACTLGAFDQASAAFAEAERHLRDIAVSARTVRAWSSLGMVLKRLADALASDGKPDAEVAVRAEGLVVARAIYDTQPTDDATAEVARALEALGHACVKTDAPRAAAVFAEAATLCSTLPVTAVMPEPQWDAFRLHAHCAAAAKFAANAELRDQATSAASRCADVLPPARRAEAERLLGGLRGDA